jgi:NTP pyrophosphatase (non-canonical NTP hydrolase)
VGKGFEATEETLKYALGVFESDVHRNAYEHGWWNNEFGDYDTDSRNRTECVALAMTELAEAIEARRKGSSVDEHCPDYSNEEIELADCMIRILDYSAAFDLDVIGAMLAKHEFNKSRPYKHGKQF